MSTVADFIRADIQALQAYHVADAPSGCIKLDAMESPYHPFAHDAELLSELAAELTQAPINLYPNPASCGLQDILRQAFDIPASADIALGNGSDELIQFLTMLVAKAGAKMLALEPSFVMYKHNAALYNLGYIGVPLNDDFSLNLDNVLAVIKQQQPALIFVAYPNNPTGVCFAREEVQAIIDAAEGIVVIDEAYGAFSHDSFLSQAGSIENLVVLRTLSKIGFAGLRIGYAAGSSVVMQELAKIIPPYNMNQLSLAAAKLALKHADVIDATTNKLKAERERMLAALSEIDCLKVFPSQANFLTVRTPDAAELFDALKQNNILIKKLHGAHVLLDQCVRITIGAPEHNDAVLAVVRSLYCWLH